MTTRDLTMGSRRGCCWVVVSALAFTTPVIAQKKDEPELQWIDIRTLDVEGQGWKDTKAPSDRLPAKAESIVRPPVWNLSRHSAGLAVRFVSDATTMQARW